MSKLRVRILVHCGNKMLLVIKPKYQSEGHSIRLPGRNAKNDRHQKKAAIASLKEVLGYFVKSSKLSREKPTWEWNGYTYHIFTLALNNAEVEKMKKSTDDVELIWLTFSECLRYAAEKGYDRKELVEFMKVDITLKQSPTLLSNTYKHSGVCQGACGATFSSSCRGDSCPECGSNAAY